MNLFGNTSFLEGRVKGFLNVSAQPLTPDVLVTGFADRLMLAYDVEDTFGVNCHLWLRSCL